MDICIVTGFWFFRIRQLCIFVIKFCMEIFFISLDSITRSGMGHSHDCTMVNIWRSIELPSKVMVLFDISISSICRCESFHILMNKSLSLSIIIFVILILLLIPWLWMILELCFVLLSCLMMSIFCVLVGICIFSLEKSLPLFCDHFNWAAYIFALRF